MTCLYPLLFSCSLFLSASLIFLSVSFSYKPNSLFHPLPFPLDGSTDAFQIVHTLSEAKYLLNLLFTQTMTPTQGQGQGHGMSAVARKATQASLDDRKAHHPALHSITNTATVAGKSSASTTTSSTSSRTQVLLALKGDLDALSAPISGREKDKEGGRETDREAGKEKDREGGKDTMQQRLALFNKTPVGTGVGLGLGGGGGGGVSKIASGAVPSVAHSSGNISSKTTVYPVKTKPPLPVMKTKPFPVRPTGGLNATATASTAAAAGTGKHSVTSSQGRNSSISSTNATTAAAAVSAGCSAASVNTNINRKNNSANVAASFVKMKENISKCLPPTAGGGGGGGGISQAQKSLMDRKNKFDKFMVQKTACKTVKKIMVCMFPFIHLCVFNTHM
jgi:hypothetical protein